MEMISQLKDFSQLERPHVHLSMEQIA